MVFNLLEEGCSLGVHETSVDYLKKKGFNIKCGPNRDYFHGESFYEEVTIEIKSLKELEFLILRSDGIRLSRHSLIIGKYIEEEPHISKFF